MKDQNKAKDKNKKLLMRKRDRHSILIEKAALAAYKQLGFNPMTILASMQIFPGDFFEDAQPYLNSLSFMERSNSWYLRDIESHDAIFYNGCSGKVQLVLDGDNWTDGELKFYKKGAKAGFAQFKEGFYDYHEGGVDFGAFAGEEYSVPREDGDDD